MSSNGKILRDALEQSILNMYANGGQMIRRADGSYSRRGLWDNVRENKGSGKKPTREMLEQEAKIRASMGYGGMYEYGGIAYPYSLVNDRYFVTGGPTDPEDEKRRALAKKVVEMANKRANSQNWVDIPENVRQAAQNRGEEAFGCIGGVCTVLNEAGAIPTVTWSNTDFAKRAKEFGFPNKGYGVKGFGNLEAGDVLQHLQSLNNQGKRYPSHAQIYLGKNESTGEHEFFDNFSKKKKTYREDELREWLDPKRAPEERQASIYKVNPYHPDLTNFTKDPVVLKALADKENMIQNQTYVDPNYTYKLRDDSPFAGDAPEGMTKFFDFANNQDRVNELVTKLGVPKSVIHDELLNTFGELGQENKWEDRTLAGSGFGAEGVIEKIFKPKSWSIGPGQIKFNSVPEDLKKMFDIKSPKDLYNWDKVLPLMTAINIKNRQWMENQGDELSAKLIGKPGVSADELKGGVGRWTPYMYRGTPKDPIKQLRKEAEKEISKDGKTEEQYNQEINDYIDSQYGDRAKLLDKNSYAGKVFANIDQNLERTRPQADWEEYTPLTKVIVTPGNNRDYSVPQRVATNSQPVVNMPTAVVPQQLEQRQQTRTNRQGNLQTESIVDYMNSRGLASDKRSRAELAQRLGIEDYDYSATKNKELLMKMRQDNLPSNKYGGCLSCGGSIYANGGDTYSGGVWYSNGGMYPQYGVAGPVDQDGYINEVIPSDIPGGGERPLPPELRGIIPNGNMTAAPVKSPGKRGPSSESIVDYLNSVGMKSDFATRKAMAEKTFGIKNYKGTADQNRMLLGLMRNPTYNPNDGNMLRPKAPGKTIDPFLDMMNKTGVGKGKSTQNPQTAKDLNSYQKYVDPNDPYFFAEESDNDFIKLIDSPFTWLRNQGATMMYDPSWANKAMSAAQLIALGLGSRGLFRNTRYEQLPGAKRLPGIPKGLPNSTTPPPPVTPRGFLPEPPPMPTPRGFEIPARGLRSPGYPMFEMGGYSIGEEVNITDPQQLFELQKQGYSFDII